MTVKLINPPYETSLFYVGWGGATGDAHNYLINLMVSRSPGSPRGLFNVGGEGQLYIGALFCAHLPANLAWLEEALCAAVDLEFLAPDFATWLPSVELAVAPDAPPPGRSPGRSPSSGAWRRSWSGRCPAATPGARWGSSRRGSAG